MYHTHLPIHNFFYSIWAAIIAYHRLGGLKTTEIYLLQFRGLDVQDQGASRFGIWWGFLVYGWLSPCCTLTWWEGKGALQVLFHRALISSMRAPSSRLNPLPKVPNANTITLGIRFPHELGEHKHSVYGIHLFIDYFYFFLAFNPFSLPIQIPFSCLSMIAVNMDCLCLPSTPLSMR